MKFNLITNREPEISFIFPPRQYKDKRSKSGYLNRFCCRDWFKRFKFLCYSKASDGLYCLACVLFPDSSHRRPKKLISEPYCNWKDAVHDLAKHSTSDYHCNSMTRLDSFSKTYSNSSTRIDVLVADGALLQVKTNREILRSIIKCLEFCGRQGIGLRGHRDDNTCSASNKGNFKACIDLRIDAGDKILEEHFKYGKRNATYDSKTSQNDLLLCMKQYIQNVIIGAVKSQQFGPYYGIVCDEVSDLSNWEQLGLILRFTMNHKPVEKLLEFIPCDTITGQAICMNIIKALTNNGLDIQYCRSQTMDGAGNMAGTQAGCAALFTKESPKAVYHYCSSHDLNLALCKSCQVKEVHVMLSTLKQLGIFFKYSPKRCRRLEVAIESYNNGRSPLDQIKKSKFGLFCETRWVEKHTTLNDFNIMYEPLIECLEAVSSLEPGWDGKAVTEAYGILKQITSSTFIASFQTVLHFFAYSKGLSTKLQGSSLDVVEAFDMVNHMKSLLTNIRSDESRRDYNEVYLNMLKMAQKANTNELEIPRRCGRQTQRNNVQAETPKEYYRLAVFIPFLDSLLLQFSMRFGHLASQAIKALTLIPANCSKLDKSAAGAIFEFYREDLISPDTFLQEVRLWQHMWQSMESKPSTLCDTLTDSRACCKTFPNVTKLIHLMLLTSVTASSVERANSSLKFVKNSFRSSMGEDRLNSLLLLYVHRDIELNIDIYARKHPRRMLLSDPLES